MRWKNGYQVVIVVNLLLCFLCAGVSAGDSSRLKEQVVEQLNLGPEVTIERYGFENNQVLLWREAADGKPGYAKNWGIVLLKKEQPQHLWFYTGPMTNSFQNFHLSFHQFTQDGRKELAIVGTDEQRRDWAHFFILNLEESGVELLHQGETNSRGGSYFVKSDEIYNQGMFMDLDLDQIEELFVYHEVKGTLLPGPIWPDVYNWEEDRFVKTNQQYPTFYIPFFQAFEAAAHQEELLDGNYKIYYEDMAQIYELWNEPVGVLQAKERAQLPPLEMGEQMVQILRAGGYQTHRVVRVDLDGVNPRDAIVWGKGIEGLRNQIWVIGQQNEHLIGPFPVPLAPSFFQQIQEDQIRTKGSIIQFSSSPDSQQNGIKYVYEFGDTGMELVGREEWQMLLDGRVQRKRAGQVLPEVGRDEEEMSIVQIPLLRAVPSEEPIRVNGFFSDPGWSKVKPISVGDESLISQGIENWQGQDDLSIRLQATHQEADLYLGVRVTDDQKQYSQEEGIGQRRVSDHVEFWLKDQGQLYHYGIFLAATGVEVIQWIDGRGQKPAHMIKAQWMPVSQGYWLELRITGLDLSKEVIPFTIGVVDVDQNGVDQIETLLTTSPYQVRDPESLGWILLQ